MGNVQIINKIYLILLLATISQSNYYTPAAEENRGDISKFNCSQPHFSLAQSCDRPNYASPLKAQQLLSPTSFSPQKQQQLQPQLQQQQQQIQQPQLSFNNNNEQQSQPYQYPYSSQDLSTNVDSDESQNQQQSQTIMNLKNQQFQLQQQQQQLFLLQQQKQNRVNSKQSIRGTGSSSYCATGNGIPSMHPPKRITFLHNIQQQQIKGRRFIQSQQQQQVQSGYTVTKQQQANNNFTFNSLSVIHKSVSNPQTASGVANLSNNNSNIFKIQVIQDNNAQQQQQQLIQQQNLIKQNYFAGGNQIFHSQSQNSNNNHNCDENNNNNSCNDQKNLCNKWLFQQQQKQMQTRTSSKKRDNEERKKDGNYNFSKSKDEITFIRKKKNDQITLPQLTPILKKNVLDQAKQAELEEEKNQLKDYESLEITAKSFSIFDADNYQLLLSHKGKKQREMASLTKIMTCYIACQRLKQNLVYKGNMVKISRQAEKMIGTTAELKAGDRLTFWSLLHGLMLPSGNDAAFAIAEFLGRQIFFESEEYKFKLQENPANIENCKTRDAVKAFICEMNQQARLIGLKSTHYANPHGLMNKHNKSCTSDQCRLSCVAMNNDIFREIVKRQEFTADVTHKSGKVRQILWENTNKLLAKNDCQGIKTGITPNAGPCLASSFMKNGRHIIIVVFKTAKIEDRFRETWKIYNWVCDKLGLRGKDEQRDDLCDIPKSDPKEEAAALAEAEEISGMGGGISKEF